MRPPIPLKNTHTLDELHALCKESKDELQKTRIRAILSIKKGKTRSDIVEMLNVSRDTVTNWVVTYNKKGVEGLKTNKGGRKEGNPKWDVSIFNKLGKEIDTKKGYWSIPKMCKWIKENEKLDVPQETIWYHMHTLEDYTYKSARPHPMKGNKEHQESFKKRA